MTKGHTLLINKFLKILDELAVESVANRIVLKICYFKEKKIIAWTRIRT